MGRGAWGVAGHQAAQHELDGGYKAEAQRAP